MVQLLAEVVVLYYRPHHHELSANGSAFTAEAVVPGAEGLVAAVGLRDASFSAIDFEHMHGLAGTR